MAGLKDLEKAVDAANKDIKQVQIDLSSVVTQVKRIISDIESEKGTRERQDARLELKLDGMQTCIEAEMKEVKKTTDDNSDKIARIIWLAGVAVLLLGPLASKLVDKLASLVGL